MALPTTVGTQSLVYTGNSSQNTYPNEWVYSNDSYGTYVTGTQVQIYVGDLFIDEIDSIQIMYYANSIPYYGYASTQADAFGRGRDIVQGQFAINFVSQGYMYVVLNEYGNTTSGSSVSSTVQNVVNLYTQLQTAMSTDQSGSGNASTTNQVQQLRQQISSASQGLSPQDLDTVSTLVAQQTGALAATTQLTATKNAITNKTPFSIRMLTTSGGRTITRIIKDCVLISNQQQIDQSGQVILDVYGFIARSFV